MANLEDRAGYGEKVEITPVELILSIDDRGRVNVDLDIRRIFNIKPGDRLYLNLTGYQPLSKRKSEE